MTLKQPDKILTKAEFASKITESAPEAMIELTEGFNQSLSLRSERLYMWAPRASKLAKVGEYYQGILKMSCSQVIHGDAKSEKGVLEAIQKMKERVQEGKIYFNFDPFGEQKVLAFLEAFRHADIFWEDRGRVIHWQGFAGCPLEPQEEEMLEGMGWELLRMAEGFSYYTMGYGTLTFPHSPYYESSYAWPKLGSNDPEESRGALSIMRKEIEGWELVRRAIEGQRA